MHNKNDSYQKPPVVVVMGHIDHGKSTLLDSIRKSNTTEHEAGGITQHLSAYEVTRETESGPRQITFLDTPGHEAFKAIRSRGAAVADIAILVVSAEDGVKPQTLEALSVIRDDGIPFVVAVNKIDKPGANVEKTKQNLAENDVFLEGYGGEVPWTAVSAKTGEGIPALLDLVLLAADLGNLERDLTRPAQGIIIESNMDPRKGVTATAIVTEGVVRKGGFALSKDCLAPLRIMEDFRGKPVNEVFPGSPVRIIGWDSLPPVGSSFACVADKKEAARMQEEVRAAKKTPNNPAERLPESVTPLIIRADTAGTLDAVVYEVSKLPTDRLFLKVISSGLGQVTENDIRMAQTDPRTLVIAMNVGTDPKAEALALRLGITVHWFNIIYKLTEWLAETQEKLTPRMEVEEVMGTAKVLKAFSRVKDKQVIGARLEAGEIAVNDLVRVIRREAEIARGRVRELQQAKNKVQAVKGEGEFGIMVEAKFDIAPGDHMEAVRTVTK